VSLVEPRLIFFVLKVGNFVFFLSRPTWCVLPVVVERSPPACRSRTSLAVVSSLCVVVHHSAEHLLVNRAAGLDYGRVGTAYVVAQSKESAHTGSELACKATSTHTHTHTHGSMVKKGDLDGGASADGSGEAVVVTADMMAPADAGHGDRLQPRRTEVGDMKNARLAIVSYACTHISVPPPQCSHAVASDVHSMCSVPNLVVYYAR
jgi:hypothetical protein